MMLRNDFHKTEVQINLRGKTTLSRYQVKRAWQELCGIRTCQCAGPAGERGQQRLDGEEVHLVHNPDGSATIEVF